MKNSGRVVGREDIVGKLFIAKQTLFLLSKEGEHIGDICEGSCILVLDISKDIKNFPFNYLVISNKGIGWLLFSFNPIFVYASEVEL